MKSAAKSGQFKPSYVLNDATWGIPGTSEEQLEQIRIFEDCMLIIVSNNFQQGPDEVAIALQLLLLLKSKKDPVSKRAYGSVYYSNAMALVHANHSHIAEALERMYKKIQPAFKLDFIKNLECFIGALRGRSFDEPIRLFLISIDFSAHLGEGVVYKFEINTNGLKLKIDNGHLLFKIIFVHEEPKVLSPNTFYIKKNSAVVDMQKFIASKAMAVYTAKCNALIPVKDPIQYAYKDWTSPFSSTFCLKWSEIRGADVTVGQDLLSQANVVRPK